MVHFEGCVARLGEQITTEHGLWRIDQVAVPPAPMEVIGHTGDGARPIGTVLFLSLRAGGEVWAFGRLTDDLFWPAGVGVLPVRADVTEHVVGAELDGQPVADAATLAAVDVGRVVYVLSARVAGVSVFGPGSTPVSVFAGTTVRRVPAPDGV